MSKAADTADKTVEPALLRIEGLGVARQARRGPCSSACR